MTEQTPEWHVQQAERWLEGAEGADSTAAQRACAELAQAHLKVADIRMLWRLWDDDASTEETE